MKAAVICPNWKAAPSGGWRQLHVLSRELEGLGVECVSVGAEYEYEHVGDTVVEPDAFESDEDTVLIVPEGYVAGAAGPYYLPFVEDQPHAAVVVYLQSCTMMDPMQEWETHYWGLGERQRTIARARMGIPDEVPIEELMAPVDTEFWCPAVIEVKVPGSIIYSPSRNPQILDLVARKTSRPAVRLQGADAKEVRQYMAESDILVMASPAEGQSSLMNEAMAMECAVVTWVSGGLPDIVTHEHDALIVAQDDVEGLIDCTRRLQKEPELARKLGENGRRTVCDLLSFDRFRERLAQLWAKISEQE